MLKISPKDKKKSNTKKMTCMNSNPEQSRWSKYAPPGGCNETVDNVDASATRVLCWKCTARAASGHYYKIN